MDDRWIITDMKRAFAVGIVLVVAGCAPASLLDMDLDAEYQRAVAWINANGDAEYTAGSRRPTVLITSQSELQRMSNLGPGQRVKAAYWPWYHVVVFADDLNMASIKDRGFLIHETEHALNRFTKYACKQAREAEAYRLQALWYEQNGTSLYAMTGLDDEAVKHLTSCAETGGDDG